MHSQVEISSSVVATIANVSLRQLQWWDVRGIVSPRHEGHRRIYDELDAVQIKVVGELRARGVPLRRAAQVVRFLSRLRQPVGFIVVTPRNISHHVGEHELVAFITGLREPAHVIDLHDSLSAIREEVALASSRSSRHIW